MVELRTSLQIAQNPKCHCLHCRSELVQMQTYVHMTVDLHGSVQTKHGHRHCGSDHVQLWIHADWGCKLVQLQIYTD